MAIFSPLAGFLGAELVGITGFSRGYIAAPQTIFGRPRRIAKADLAHTHGGTTVDARYRTALVERGFAGSSKTRSWIQPMADWCGDWFRYLCCGAMGRTNRSQLDCGSDSGTAVSLLFVGFMYFSTVELAAPWWTVGLTLLIPLAATLVATSAWMDGRTGWRFWSWHAGMLSLSVLLPSMGFLSYIAMYPRMSAAIRQQLQHTAAISHPGMTWDPSAMTLTRKDQAEPAEASSKQHYETMAEYRQHAIENLRNQMANSSTSLGDWSALKAIVADAIMQRLADPSATDVSRKEHYRESIGLLLELTAGNASRSCCAIKISRISLS